jgi:serine phosphatase RsbU (regulator of sigma subunit)
VERLRLLLAPEHRRFSGGSDILLRSDAERLKPPDWADSIQITDDLDDSTDCVLLLLKGPPSSTLRRFLFEAFRRSVPCAALAEGDLSVNDPVTAKLEGWNRLWRFESSDTLRHILFRQVQDWILGISRETSTFPSGDELLAEWGAIDPASIDDGLLEHADAMLARRGFVCLSGSLGAGKTTMSRCLLERSAELGMKPVEHIAPDLDGRRVESVLKGPEDCAMLLDLDTMRRTAPLFPIDLWMFALTQIIRSTEPRRRLVLASSSPRIAAVFDLFHEAHVRLPEPGTSRRWRLDQGMESLKDFRSMDNITRAEFILLSMFEPVVPETLFREALFSFWRRLFIMIHSRFPADDRLEELYSQSHAARGVSPFRRIRFRGETRIATGDTVLMTGIDDGIREMIHRNDPVIRILAETLVFSEKPQVRRAGYSLFFFYEHLPEEEKANLLYALSRETLYENMMDQFSMLMSSEELVDEAVLSLCTNIIRHGSDNARRAVAGCLGKPWIRRSPRLRPMLDEVVGSGEPSVRAEFMRSVDIWRLDEDPGGYYGRLLDDGSPEVRNRLLNHIGSCFPDISGRETEILNGELQRSDDQALRAILAGLLNRRPEEFGEEFSDLLWLVVDRLREGGRGILATYIGGRLRFFGSEIRTLLVSDMREEDEFDIVQCLLMNYQWLTWSEMEALWSVVMQRTPGNLEFASMVLRYFQAMGEREQELLVSTVLTFEPYSGREALSQLLASGRTDLADVTLRVMGQLAESGTVEHRSRLPWFLLWNREAFGDRVDALVAGLAADRYPSVRGAIASAVRRLGYDEPQGLGILTSLASDTERSVRAAAGEALGELSCGTRDDCVHAACLRGLLGDPDPFVRTRTLAGCIGSTGIDTEEKTELVTRALADPDASVRRGVLFSLDQSRDLCTAPGVDAALGGLLSDPSEDVRLEAIRLVTSQPELLSSENLRQKLPDLFLDRLSSGGDIAEELSTARQIQLDLLPEHPPVLDGYDIEVFYRPAREVGGDYYDFFTLPGNNTGMAIADVMGKGIPAALTMASLKGNLGAYVRSVFSISEVIGRVNEAIASAGEDAGLVGLFYGVLNAGIGELTYVNAGHNPPFLFRREGDVVRLDKGGLLMGFRGDTRYEFGVEMMETGDVLVLYTDGITETMSPDGVEFGESGLIETVSASRDLSARQIASAVLSASGSFGEGSPQSDDQTLVVVKHR